MIETLKRWYKKLFEPIAFGKKSQSAQEEKPEQAVTETLPEEPSLLKESLTPPEIVQTTEPLAPIPSSWEPAEPTELKRSMQDYFEGVDWENTPELEPLPLEQPSPSTGPQPVSQAHDAHTSALGQTMGLFFEQASWNNVSQVEPETLVPSPLAEKILHQNINAFFQSSNWQGNRVDPSSSSQTRESSVQPVPVASLPQVEEDSADSFFDDIDW